MDMIERVARAIAANLDFNTTWEDCGPGFRETCFDLARAAIEEMRKPTELMLEDAIGHMDSWSSNMAWWDAMITAALKEHEGAKG